MLGEEEGTDRVDSEGVRQVRVLELGGRFFGVEDSGDGECEVQVVG